ncbi:MAG: hypothetical protein QOD83_3025 [Solirubrobacteraceae bacterium]|jgi:hypothetical protein|nr:hypothetical protein [Solirubrobacteraceae bacterium]
MTVESTTKDKQITIDVPEDRVAEFYAFYGRFLAGFPGRRRRGIGPRGHHCGSHREDRQTEAAVPAQPPDPERLRPDIADA